MFNTYINIGGTSIDLIENDHLSEILAYEGCENLANYVEWLGFNKDPDLIVLSSMHHYYYDVEEMKNVKTVVNLKQLNQIKHVRDFLHSVFRILPLKCNFIGCFTDNTKKNGLGSLIDSSDSEAVENGIISRNPFLNMIYSMMDSRTYKSMSRKSVRLLLEDHGLKVLDITEFDDLTYFCAQKVRTNNN